MLGRAIPDARQNTAGTRTGVRVATLNTRGVRSGEHSKPPWLFDLPNKHDVDIAAIQEAKITKGAVPAVKWAAKQQGHYLFSNVRDKSRQENAKGGCSHSSALS